MNLYASFLPVLFDLKKILDFLRPKSLNFEAKMNEIRLINLL